MFSKIEGVMETVVEGSFTRLFRSKIHPADITKRLERIMEDTKEVAVGKSFVPNRYEVYLHPDDFAQLASYKDEIERDMSRHVREYGQQRRFIFTGDIPRVWLNASDQQKKRGFTIRAYTVDPGQPQPNITIPAGQPQALEGTAILNIGAVPLTGQQKQIARSPGFNRPQVSLTVLKYPASNPNRLFMFDRDIVIGRGLDNDVVLPDEPRISRQHARIEFKYGQFLLTDLNSSNGTAVNGRPITQIVLAPGDTISLGGVEILFSVEA